VSSPDGDNPSDANLQTRSLVLGAGSALVTAGATIMVSSAVPGVALIAIGLLLILFALVPQLHALTARRQRPARQAAQDLVILPTTAATGIRSQMRYLLPLVLASFIGVLVGVGAVVVLLPRFSAQQPQTNQAVGVVEQGCASGSPSSTQPANAPGSSVSDGAVAMFRVNPARTGVQPGPGPVGNPVLQRTFAVAGSITASPAIVDAVAYIGTWDGVVYAWAVSSEEDSPRWVFRTQGPIYSSAAVAGGTVYVGSGDGCLYAIDAANGNERWRFASGQSISSSPAVVDGVAYVGNGTTSSTQATFYALDAANGTERWHFDVNGGIYSSPAIANGIVYFGLWNRALTTFYALDASSGEQRWSFKTSGEVYASPVVVDDTVLVADYTGHLYALYASNGVQRWTFNAFDGPMQYDYDRLIYASPAVTEDTAYVIGWSNNLYAVDTATGKEQWRLDISDDPNAKPGDDRGPRSSPALADGVIYAGSDDGNIYAVDAATGKNLWQYATTGPVASSPIVWAGAVYVGVENDEGSLIAIGGSDTAVSLGATPTKPS
jgi:outer membrane protein assembly factor BamB/uncharacterized membrane protein HdeD (DUF308 family)